MQARSARAWPNPTEGSNARFGYSCKGGIGDRVPLFAMASPTFATAQRTVRVTLVRDVITHNESHGVFVVSTTTADARALLSDNTFEGTVGNDLRVDGPGAIAVVSGNVENRIHGSSFACTNGGNVSSLGNKLAPGVDASPPTCVQPSGDL